MRFEPRKYRVNGMELNAVVAGEGPDVLLVHGFPDTHEVWRLQIPVLVDAGFRVIAPDTRGCGESDAPARVADYAVDRLVADLVALLDVLGVEKVRLVGHDWGAVISWHLAIAYPRRVDRYVAMSVGHPTAYASGGIMQKIRGYYVLLLQLRGVAEFLLTRRDWRLFGGMTRYPDALPRWRVSLSRPGRLTAAVNYYRANLGLIVSARCPSAKVPVLGLWSSGDAFLTERQMLASRRHVEGPWRYARIEGANHWLQLTAPDEVNRLLLEYLRSPLETAR
jgi:pimeloyl-ACP methyl ester carboxylesterase